MKSVFKFLRSIVIGMLIGFCLVLAGFALFSDRPIAELMNAIVSVDMVVTMIASFMAVILALVMQTLLHEAGHLLFGLLTGYRFVSFRIFNFTIINKEGRFTVKRYSVLGTAGQCLMSPPANKPLHEAPYALYNLGGVIVNITVSTIALVALLMIDRDNCGPFTIMFLSFTVLSGLVLTFLNGIPMKIGGMPNDGFNGLYLGRSTNGRVCFGRQLLINEQLQNGVRLRDMPQEWFEILDINYEDPLQLNVAIMKASRLIDSYDFAEALKELEHLSEPAKKFIIFNREVDSELVFLYLVSGDVDKAKALYTKQLEAYVMHYAKTMSSKDRVRFALALYADNNPERALRLINNLKNHAHCYLLQGEVESDLAIMNHLLNAKA